MTLSKVIILLMTITMAWSQRGSFAGSKPIGFPELEKPSTTVNPLGNRFGEDDATTQRLPLEALGDKDLVDRLNTLPVDNRPFWLTNWLALEEQRKNPQVYPQYPSFQIFGPEGQTAYVPGGNFFIVNSGFGESSTPSSQTITVASVDNRNQLPSNANEKKKEENTEPNIEKPSKNDKDTANFVSVNSGLGESSTSGSSQTTTIASVDKINQLPSNANEKNKTENTEPKTENPLKNDKGQPNSDVKEKPSKIN